MHKQEIPLFSVPDANTISSYVPFRRTSFYLKKQSSTFRDIRKLLALCGYSSGSSYGKFLRHQREWHDLKRNIPLKYLTVIGAVLEEIQATVEVDAEEYESILRLPFFPKNGIIRLMATVYSEYCFEPGTTEEEAVEILKEFSKENNLRACINFSGIKTTWTEPSGEINYSYYYPMVKITKTHLIPSCGGQGIGKVFIR